MNNMTDETRSLLLQGLEHVVLHTKRPDRVDAATAAMEWVTNYPAGKEQRMDMEYFIEQSTDSEWKVMRRSARGQIALAYCLEEKDAELVLEAVQKLAAQPQPAEWQPVEPTEDDWYWFQGVRHGRLDQNETIDFPLFVFRGTVQMLHGEYSRKDFDGKFYRIASPAPYAPTAAE